MDPHSSSSPVISIAIGAKYIWCLEHNGSCVILFKFYYEDEDPVLCGLEGFGEN